MAVALLFTAAAALVPYSATHSVITVEFDGVNEFAMYVVVNEEQQMGRIRVITVDRNWDQTT